MMHWTGRGSRTGSSLLQVMCIQEATEAQAQSFTFLWDPCLSAAWQSFSVGCERGDCLPRAANPSLLVLFFWKERH